MSVAVTWRQPDPESYDEKGASPGRAWVGFSSSTSYFQYQRLAQMLRFFEWFPPNVLVFSLFVSFGVSLLFVFRMGPFFWQLRPRKVPGACYALKGRGNEQGVACLPAKGRRSQGANRRFHATASFCPCQT